MARVGLDEVHDAEGFVDADEGFFVGGWCTFDEGEVGFAGEFVDVNVLLELAPRGLYGCVAHVFEQAFGAAAVFDEVGNGADFEIVFFGELHQFGHARHGAVVVDDFADDGGGNQTVHLCQVNAGFGMSGTDEYAAFLGAQWEDVAGLDDVFWFGGWGNGGLNGQGAVGGRNAGGNAVGGFDGDGKVGAVLRAVFWVIMGRPSFSTISPFIGRQTRPRAFLIMKLMASGVTNWAAISKSPSFSRSSASVMMTILPALMSARISGMVEMWDMVFLSWLMVGAWRSWWS